MTIFHYEKRFLKIFLITFHHVFYKDPVSFFRLSDKYMGDRSYNLSILQNRASAHPLHDPAGLGKQHRISHRQGNILVTVIFISKLRDLDIIKCSCSVKGRINLCRSFLYFLLELLFVDQLANLDLAHIVL